MILTALVQWSNATSSTCTWGHYPSKMSHNRVRLPDGPPAHTEINVSGWCMNIWVQTVMRFQDINSSDFFILEIKVNFLKPEFGIRMIWFLKVGTVTQIAYRKVANRSTSCLVVPLQDFQIAYKEEIYLLWPFGKK